MGIRWVPNGGAAILAALLMPGFAEGCAESGSPTLPPAIGG